MEAKYKSGFVTLIGRPNVGKSTLMNHLIGQKIAITSDKPQTTRNKIQTVYTGKEGQIIFIDTPGIHKAKNKLGQFMVNVAERTLREVDIVLWLVEPSTFIGAGERHIAEQLKKVNTPVFLIINKIDTVKKEEILAFIAAYKDILQFAEIIPVSALKGENTDTLLDMIFRYLPEGPQYYDEDTITDQPEKQIAAELIREKALRLLSDEIPHGIAVSIEHMKERKLMRRESANYTGEPIKDTGKSKNDAGKPVNYTGESVDDSGEDQGSIMDIGAVIICEKDSHKGIIIGKNGAMLKKIGTQARMEIENLLDCKVNLKLWVKVKKDWRDSDFLIKNYGYNTEL